MLDKKLVIKTCYKKLVYKKLVYKKLVYKKLVYKKLVYYIYSYPNNFSNSFFFNLEASTTKPLAHTTSRNLFNDIFL